MPWIAHTAPTWIAMSNSYMTAHPVALPALSLSTRNRFPGGHRLRRKAIVR
jgi:hypothetical protein